MTTSVYDVSLRRAFDSVDRDHSGSLSKRQLYAARDIQLACAPSEQLKIWEPSIATTTARSPMRSSVA